MKSGAGAGVFKAKKKNGTEYYRASLTYKGKHISLGSRDTLEEANRLYREAHTLLHSDLFVTDYTDDCALSFDKWVILVNVRDNGVYIKNPIYLSKRFFSYFLNPQTELKFDNEDLFFYSIHKIQVRGGHLFCENFGAQMNLKARYGIRPYAVAGKDYFFINGDDTDYRYANIEVVNNYHGVTEQVNSRLKKSYIAKIHINGVYQLGTYASAEEAAIAYNKAVDLLSHTKIKKPGMPTNYIEDLSPSDYAHIYTDVVLSESYLNYLKENA
ncbi:MAG: hypothetical protein K6F99_06415 [Lachnospiraceae bacterium]|nr:hypothetical protein [Lachnospiraceae bacterium]